MINIVRRLVVWGSNRIRPQRAVFSHLFFFVGKLGKIPTPRYRCVDTAEAVVTYIVFLPGNYREFDWGVFVRVGCTFVSNTEND